VDKEIMTINLGAGQLAQIGDEDRAVVAGYRWKPVFLGKWYCHAYDQESRRWVFLHHLIALQPIPPFLCAAMPLVDHRAGDGLNCQRSNLRYATHAQNMQNSAVRLSVRQSRFKGGRMAGQWRAQIKAHGHQRHLGHFATGEAAAEAYNAAASECFGGHISPTADCVLEPMISRGLTLFGVEPADGR
jgi:hypothetical protein